MAQSIELRADLADFAAEHFIEGDDLVLALGRPGGGTRDRQAESPFADERHAVFVDVALLVHFAALNEPRRLQHLLGGHVLGGASLIGGTPLGWPPIATAGR